MKINRKEIAVATTCPSCGRVTTIKVSQIDFFEWKGGALVQDAFPYLSPEEREMLVSGICPTCWDDIFPEDEDDDDYEPDYDECGFNPYMGCYDYDC